MEQCSDLTITRYLSFAVPGREASFWVRGAKTVILNVSLALVGRHLIQLIASYHFGDCHRGRQRFVQETRTVSRSRVQTSSVENLATTLTCVMLYFDSLHTKRAHSSFSLPLLRYFWKLLRQLVIPSNCKAPITSPNNPTIPNKDYFLIPLSIVYSLRYANLQNYILNCKKIVEACYQVSIL